MILSLIYPVREENLTAEQKEALLQAERLQEDYEKQDGGDGVISRSVGDVSVRYGSAGQLTVNGRRISPHAAALLQNAGLLCRWV